MPREKLPPDKYKLSALYTNVSKAVDSLYVRKEIEVKSGAVVNNTNTAILPSNVNSKVSAENLRQELFGKYNNVKKNSICEDLNHKLSASFPARDNSVTKKCDRITLPSKIRINEAMVCHQRHNNHPSSKLISHHHLQSSSSTRRNMSVSHNTKIIPPRTCLPPIPSKIPIRKPSKSPLVEVTKYLLTSSSPMIVPKFRFAVSREAINYNLSVLRQNDYNLHNILNPSNSLSVTSYGSEFQSVQDLDNLLCRHPRWPNLQKILENGSHWFLNDIDDVKRKEDVDLNLLRGNHKSAKIHQDFLSNALKKEIQRGWILALPIECATHIPNLMLSPMGVANQLGINNSGDFVPKLRVTHDLSFPGQASNESVNSTVVDEVLEPCMFGHTMLRIIHRIVHLRKLHPQKIIWIRKEDIKSAYRRIHLSSETAVKTSVQLEIDQLKLLLISLRLPFGGSPCPSEFCLFSDIVTDTINDLMADESWNPLEVFSNYIKYIPPPKPIHNTVPFAQAEETSIQIQEGDICKADVFIDDIITVGVDVRDNLQRVTAAPCTVLHAMAHKSSSDTHVIRQNLIADDKNEAEGAPEEIKIVLGWELNSRSLSVHLPLHKFKAWIEQISSFLTRKTSNIKDIQSILGRLENISVMVPMMAHFLNNLRQIEIKANITGKNQVITKRVKDDCLLAKKFIHLAHCGISMNSITFRTPTKIYINDASEHGLGGFACHGRAWSWEIPEKLRGRAHINLLEFIAQLISIWIDEIEGRLTPFDCLLGMGDNTASMGWLRRSNFRENDEDDVEWIIKQKIARKVAEIVLKSKACLYRQWFKGEENTVADSLSRDAYFLPCKTHKQFLSVTVPHQLPTGFNISPIPSEIASFISSLMLQMPVKKLRFKAQKPSDLARSNVGLLSSLVSESTTCISKTSQDSNRISSCPRSHKQCEKPPSLLQLKMNWWKEQSVPPSHMWHRPSGQTIGLTPDWTSTVKLASSSKNNSEGIATKMVADKSSKLYL